MRKLMNGLMSVATLAAMAFGLGCPSAHAELIELMIKNGSFENSPNGLSDWNNNGALTHVNYSTFGSPADGSCYVVLAKSGATTGGAISESLATVVGQKYNLKFSYAALTETNALSKSLTCNITGSPVHTCTVTATAADVGKLTPWVEETISFTATATATTVRFDGMKARVGWYGVAIDKISVNPVPEPGTTMLFGIGVAGLLAFAWRKRKATGR